MTKAYIKHLSYQILGAAMEVHKVLGPGLLESIYERCMLRELELRGLNVTSQCSVPINYKGVELEAPLRYDLLVEECIVVELKAVLELHPIFDAKAMTYANLLKVPKAIIINFTCTNIWEEGQKSFVNKYYSALPDK